MTNYTSLFLSFLNYYSFQEISPQESKRDIFKESMATINPGMDPKEINKLTSHAFHLPGFDLVEKHASFQDFMHMKIVSSLKEQRIFLFDTVLKNNHLAYDIDDNSYLGKSYIRLYFNGINLVSVHINDQAHLDIVHKQYLYQLNENPSFFEQNLFNALYAEGQLYFGQLSSDLNHFNHILDQPFHNIYTNQMVHDMIQSKEGRQKQRVSVDFKDHDQYALAFRHVHLILGQVWSNLNMTYLLKTNINYSDGNKQTVDR